jgi:hypothetical protein
MTNSFGKLNESSKMSKIDLRAPKFREGQPIRLTRNQTFYTKKFLPIKMPILREINHDNFQSTGYRTFFAGSTNIFEVSPDFYKTQNLDNKTQRAKVMRYQRKKLLLI